MVRGVLVALACTASCGRVGFDVNDGGGSDRDAAIDAFVPPGSIASIGAGYNNLYAVRGDGSLLAWGANDVGQIGDGAIGPDASTPVIVGAGGWARVDGGGDRACGRKLDGTVWCWGQQVAQVLTQPTLAYPGTWDRFAAGRHLTFVANATDVVEWNDSVNPGGVSTHTFVVNDLETYDDHTCAIDSGSLLCWGANSDGQVGDGTMTPRSTPQVVGTGGWRDVGVGHPHSCAIRSDRTLWCWGGNGTRELGLGDQLGRSTPTQVGTDADWDHVYLGGHHGCAIKLDRSLWCWGTLATSWSRDTPTRDAGAWLTVAGGEDFLCALREDRTLWCVGYNSNGQLGLGDMMSRSSLSQVTLP